MTRQTMHQSDDNESSYEDDAYDETIREKIKGMDFAVRMVHRAISKWMKDPYSPPPNEEGVHIVELGYRKVDKPLKRFMFGSDDNLREFSENIVYAAGVDLVSSTSESESYVVRFFGGNDSFAFVLSVDAPKEARRETSMVMTKEHEETNGNVSFYGQKNLREPFALQLAHNVDLVRQNNALTKMLLDWRRDEEESKDKTIQSQQEIINRMVDERYKMIDARDEAYSRKHELDAQIREEDRKAKREEMIMQKAEKLLMGIVLPSFAKKLGVPPSVLMGQAPPQEGEGEAEASTENPVENALHSLFSSIEGEQFTTIAATGKVELTTEQRAKFVELMSILSQRAAETSDEPSEKG